MLLLYQCCGTIMIYCGSGSDLGKVSVVPDPEAQFFNQQNWYKILPFQYQEQHYFPESCPLSF